MQAILKKTKNKIHNNYYSKAEIKIKEAININASNGTGRGLPEKNLQEILNLILYDTKNDQNYKQIMTTLWKNINDHDKNWYKIDKSLTILKYLIENGPDKIFKNGRENIFILEMVKIFHTHSVMFNVVGSGGLGESGLGLLIGEKAHYLVNLLKGQRFEAKSRDDTTCKNILTTRTVPSLHHHLQQRQSISKSLPLLPINPPNMATLNSEEEPSISSSTISCNSNSSCFSSQLPIYFNFKETIDCKYNPNLNELNSTITGQIQMSLPLEACDKICRSNLFERNGNDSSSFFKIKLYEAEINKVKYNDRICTQDTKSCTSSISTSSTSTLRDDVTCKIFYKNLIREIRLKINDLETKHIYGKKRPKFLIFTILYYQILVRKPRQLPLRMSSVWSCEEFFTIGVYGMNY